MLLPYTRLLTLVNYEPGLIVLYWSCRCGEEHITATGRIGSADPARAMAAIDSVRRLLALGTTSATGTARPQNDVGVPDASATPGPAA
jgi:hypothetical protein